MQLHDLNPTQIDQCRFQLDGDMTATVAIVTLDGKLEIISNVSMQDAREFQQRVEIAKQERLDNPGIQRDPAEDEPGPPVSQNPCEICGQVHATHGNPSCLCAFCYQYREIVHSGACAECASKRFGGIFEQLGTPLESSIPVKPPWQK